MSELCHFQIPTDLLSALKSYVRLDLFYILFQIGLVNGKVIFHDPQ